jgi:23S rRNA (uracil1939-C5)-methyltransferase
MGETVEITGLAHGGHGVCRIDGQVCFVAHALPGDVIEPRITRRTKGVLWAEIGRIAEPSPFRIEANCPVFGTCGGCSWLHFAYPAQAEWKQRIVADTVKRIGRVETEVGWAENPDLRIGYRTRAEFQTGDGEWGFYAARSHRVVDIEHCPLCHPKLNAVFDRLRDLHSRSSVEVAVNPEGDEVLLWTHERERNIEQAFLMVNHYRDNRDREQFSFDGVPIVNGAFSQSSLLLNRLLVQQVHAALGDAARVLDLYCGNGNFSLGLDAEVIGFDHNRAVINAANRIGSKSYRVGKEATFAKALREEEYDAIILDPPRAGAKAIVPALAEADCNTIVYVSCDPATLARDVRGLVEAGWSIDTLTAVDMFPNTPHIETVCRLSR